MYERTAQELIDLEKFNENMEHRRREHAELNRVQHFHVFDFDRRCRYCKINVRQYEMQRTPGTTGGDRPVCPGHNVHNTN